MTNTIRQRLRGYEFSDEQEMTLTLELLGRVEKDIDELRTVKNRSGFSVYVGLVGIVGTLYALLDQLKTTKELSFEKVGIIFFAAILFSKILVSVSELLVIDRVEARIADRGRYYWSNDFFFEHRLQIAFQILVFLVSFALLFYLTIPIGITVLTAFTFFLYLLMFGTLLVSSFKKVIYRPNVNWSIVFHSTLVAFSGASIVGLLLQMELPLGVETRSFVIAGLLFILVSLIQILIGLTSPSSMLKKLTSLRNDIIFLRTSLKDAWTRYEMYTDGQELTEELRDDIDEIVLCFNRLDFLQSQKKNAVSAIQEELILLESKPSIKSEDFKTIEDSTRAVLMFRDEIGKIYEYLNPRYGKVSEQILKITKGTQEWEKADNFHRYIRDRDSSLNRSEVEIQKTAMDLDQRIKEMRRRMDFGNQNEDDSNENELRVQPS